MILKSILAALSPGGPKARLSIFIFHRVLSQQDPLFPSEQDIRRFDEVLSWIGQWFRVLPLDQAVMQLRTGELPSRAAAITFDDGYADNATNALPVLQHHGMCATFFVATSFLDGGRMWNDTLIETVRTWSENSLDLRDLGLENYSVSNNSDKTLTVEALLQSVKHLAPDVRNEIVAEVQKKKRMPLPDNLMMTSQQVIQLRDAGMQIGAHTCTHPILAKLPDNDAYREITGSKTTLEALLKAPVTLFAYPNGKPGQDYLDKHATMVQQAGFHAAASTASGVASDDSDVFQLPRFTPWDRTRTRYGVRSILNYF